MYVECKKGQTVENALTALRAGVTGTGTALFGHECTALPLSYNTAITKTISACRILIYNRVYVHLLNQIAQSTAQQMAASMMRSVMMNQPLLHARCVPAFGMARARCLSSRCADEFFPSMVACRGCECAWY